MPGRNAADTSRRKVRVLMVDDSPAILNLLTVGFSRHDQIEIVGTAQDPYDARDKIKCLDPDVLTLDVEMPRMNGLDFLERIMRLRPMPVVMFSSITPEGSSAAIRALALGAVDVQVKPVHGIDAYFLRDFAERVVMAAGSRRTRAAPAKGLRGQIEQPEVAGLEQWNGKIVLIGASTGGVAAIETVLAGLPANAPPIVIAQHMPESFLASFAQRLNQRSPLKVQIARDGDVLAQGGVYLAAGGDRHTIVERRGRHFVCRDKEGPKRNGHYPSVDELFFSAVDFAECVVGTILTGLGRDGADGLKVLRDAGATTLGQNAETCVVYGMPRAANDLGAVDGEYPLKEIAGEICRRADKRGLRP